MLLLAWGLGMGITVTLKMVLTMSCRAVQYRSFFRVRPNQARVSSIALATSLLPISLEQLSTRATTVFYGKVPGGDAVLMEMEHFRNDFETWVIS